MSNPQNKEVTDKQFNDITKLIKVLSESLKTYIESITDPSKTPGKDASLMAMQVLSLLCGYRRGYTRTELDELWEKSVKVSDKIRAIKNIAMDKVDPGLQMSILSGIKNSLKN